MLSNSNDMAGTRIGDLGRGGGIETADSNFEALQ